MSCCGSFVAPALVVLNLRHYESKKLHILGHRGHGKNMWQKRLAWSQPTPPHMRVETPKSMVLFSTLHGLWQCLSDWGPSQSLQSGENDMRGLSNLHVVTNAAFWAAFHSQCFLSLGVARECEGSAARVTAEVAALLLGLWAILLRFASIALPHYYSTTDITSPVREVSDNISWQHSVNSSAMWALNKSMTLELFHWWQFNEKFVNKILVYIIKFTCITITLFSLPYLMPRGPDRYNKLYWWWVKNLFAICLFLFIVVLCEEAFLFIWNCLY